MKQDLDSPADDWLAEAIFAGSEADLRLALELGANPNAVFEFGESPLGRAVIASSDEGTTVRIVLILLEAGARVIAETPFLGDTSVHCAAERGFNTVLRKLLAADGASALGKYDVFGHSPMACAVKIGHQGTAQLLLDAGADVNAQDEAHAGNTVLTVAVQEKNVEMVEFLLSCGADPRRPGWMQLSALDRASDWKDSTRHPELQRIYALLDGAAKVKTRR